MSAFTFKTPFVRALALITLGFSGIAAAEDTSWVSAAIAEGTYASVENDGVETLLVLNATTFAADLAEPAVLKSALVLRNLSDVAVTYTFKSSQNIEIEIRNAEGEVVRRSSQGHMFLQVISEITLQAGAEKILAVELPLVDSLESALVGTYEVTGFLPSFEASEKVSMDIVIE